MRTRAALELVALANRWPLLNAPALELPGGRVELGALRPIELRLGIRSTRNGRQIPLSEIETGPASSVAPPPPGETSPLWTSETAEVTS